jgi:hypothetical protein
MPSLPRSATVLLLPLLLAACATPRETCIRGATADLRATQAALSEARENVARGYAVFSQQVPYTVYATCYRTDAAGARVPFPCPQTAYRTESTPVAIDVAEERGKIRALERRLPALERQARAGVAQCEATYPATG